MIGGCLSAGHICHVQFCSNQCNVLYLDDNLRSIWIPAHAHAQIPPSQQRQKHCPSAARSGVSLGRDRHVSVGTTAQEEGVEAGEMPQGDMVDIAPYARDHEGWKVPR